MMPDQWERGIVMIERGIAPAAGIVARTTVCAELAAVGVFGGVTGVTIGGCAFVHAVAVAGTTLDIRMQTRQREGSVAVIEDHVCPFCGNVTGTATGPELTVVSVSGSVTAITILGRSPIYVVGVTRGTSQTGV